MPDDRRTVEREESAEAPSGQVVDADRRRGRGARSNPRGRFESELRETFDDGWESIGELEPFKTDVYRETAKSIISTNDSPDISFEQSINPYRGCEHGCIYCFARPTHSYLGHSAGLDFETKLYAKVNAAELLERELAHPRYVPKYIALGAVTDPYQPIEREHRITRSILEVLERAGPSRRHRHQVGARGARRRHPRAHGGPRPRQGGDLRHHARPPHRPQDGAARGHPAAGGSRPSARSRKPACRWP